MYINQRNDKDCLQATLANLLSIDYETIPVFYEAYLRKKDVDDFLLELDTWLNSIGKYRILFDVSVRDDGKIRIPIYCGRENFICIGILEKPGRGYSHAVLLHITRRENGFKISIEHDPKPDSEYTLNDLVQIVIVVDKNYNEKLREIKEAK